MAGVPASSHSSGLPLGLTGATAATRYVGATASGAPGSGTFQAGDFVVDQTGKVWVCTVAGSPGTWVQVGGGGVTVKSYVEFTTTVTISATTEGAATTVVTAAGVTFDGSTLATVEFSAVEVDIGAAGNVFFVLYDDSGSGAASIGKLANFGTGTGVIGADPVFLRRYFTPSNATHTFSIRAYKAGSGTYQVTGGTGGVGNFLPGYIRVTTGG